MTNHKDQNRIPLNTFAIAFGVAGQATVWSTITVSFRWPPVISTVLWLAAGGTWLWLIGAHVRRGFRSADSLRDQLRHPAQGPIAAIVPAIGVMLGSELFSVWPPVGAVITVASLLASALFAGWILAQWHQGKLLQVAFHGAYLLPTVGASFIASIAAGRLGLTELAAGAFGVGVFFWIVTGTVLLSRLAFFPPLPDPLKPTLAIILAPPALGGEAWFTMNGHRSDALASAFLGVFVVTLLFQLFMIPTYRRTQFSLGFWSFTFPVAAAASFGIEWMRIADFPYWPITASAAAALSTSLTVAIAVRSLVLVTSVRRGGRRAERTLRRADDSVELRAESLSAAIGHPRTEMRQ